MNRLKIAKIFMFFITVILLIILPNSISNKTTPSVLKSIVNNSLKNNMLPTTSFLSSTPQPIDIITKQKVERKMTKTQSTQEDGQEKSNLPKMVVYLTIDDGPSVETPTIIDILDKEEVKATFFIVGYNCVRYPSYLKLIAQKKHLIGNHSYSHKYQYIYKSFKNFVLDFEKAQDTIYKTVGQYPKYYRFPGGSLNRVTNKIKKFLDDKKVVYIDWNAITGDSSKDHDKLKYTDIIRETFSTIGSKKEIVLLMHDSPAKKNVVEALPYIIKELKQRGYIFETVDKMTNPLQFRRK